MKVTFNILLGLSLIVAVVFALLIFFTAKGDAMSSGGGGIRTTFKGKASFDDYVSRMTLILGAGFMILMLVLDMLNAQLTRHAGG